MIRVVMAGRLGNNLFQYAFGRALAEKHGVPLILDASWFNRRSHRYVRHLERLPGVEAGSAKLVRPFSLGSRVLKKVCGRHHWEFLGRPTVREPLQDHSFDPTLLNAPDDCVVLGFFQSPLYFADIESALRKEFATDGLGLEAGFETLADRLREPSSVAVHVRRSDYVGNRDLARLDHSYYLRAMNRIRESVEQAHFHVFSDDPVWCSGVFDGPDVTVNGHSDPFAPLVDLHLMSLASHHIIANSTFSWWGAWLGTKSGQQVFMPDVWFERGIHAPVEEKLLKGWQLMPVRSKLS